MPCQRHNISAKHLLHELTCCSGVTVIVIFPCFTLTAICSCYTTPLCRHVYMCQKINNGKTNIGLS